MSDDVQKPEETAAATPAPGEQQAQPAAQQSGDAFDSIDYDRLAGGDEEYAKAVNAAIADAPVPGDAPAKSNVEAPPEKPAQGEEFVTFEDGDPIYKGEPFKVKKSELKQFVQKGRHMERTLEEIAPLRRLATQSPELAAALREAAKDPKALEKLVRAAQGKPAPEEEKEDDLADLQVEGLHPDDVKNVAKVAKAIRDRETVKERRAREAEELRVQAEAERRDVVARANVHALRTHEGEVFDEVRPYMKKLMDEAEREASPEVFQKFKAVVTDPFAVDKHGSPVFNAFYARAKEMYLADKGAPQRQPAARTQPTNTARIQPGGSSPLGSARTSSEPDWQNMSQAEFDKRMNAALQRAD